MSIASESQQVLVRMAGCPNPPALQVGMETGVAPLEHSLGVSPKIKRKITS